MESKWKNGVFHHGTIATNKIGFLFPEKPRPIWNKKNVWYQTKIETILGRWFRALTILGCTSFYVKNGEFRTSIPRFFYPVFLIAMDSFLIGYLVYYDAYYTKLSILERYLLCFEEVTFFLVPNVFYIFLQRRKRKWIVLLTNLSKVENHLGEVHNRYYKFVFFLIAPCIILVAVISSFLVQINLLLGLVEFFTILTATSSFTAVNLYGFLLKTIRSNYELIISKISKTDGRSINGIMDISNTLLNVCSENWSTSWKNYSSRGDPEVSMAIFLHHTDSDNHIFERRNNKKGERALQYDAHSPIQSAKTKIGCI
ncbi:uncharacterized protein LOC112127600 [Cimex lectularius]|uniref:Uncharacterized protein n=1 Tax=Cimex lectularius TaxID=79782 RepID=A0A8I6TMM7_CIMLE|nr:uncharacterized protein LOC112127600 [Cimex lectularius]